MKSFRASRHSSAAKSATCCGLVGPLDDLALDDLGLADLGLVEGLPDWVASRPAGEEPFGEVAVLLRGVARAARPPDRRSELSGVLGDLDERHDMFTVTRADARRVAEVAGRVEVEEVVVSALGVGLAGSAA